MSPCVALPMRHEFILWVVSAAISAAAHAGIMAGAGHIKFEPKQEQDRAEIVLGDETLQTLTVTASPVTADRTIEAGTPSSKIEAAMPSTQLSLGADLASEPDLSAQRPDILPADQTAAAAAAAQSSAIEALDDTATAAPPSAPDVSLSRDTAQATPQEPSAPRMLRTAPAETSPPQTEMQNLPSAATIEQARAEPSVSIDPASESGTNLAPEQKPEVAPQDDSAKLQPAALAMPDVAEEGGNVQIAPSRATGMSPSSDATALDVATGPANAIPPSTGQVLVPGSAIQAAPELTAGTGAEALAPARPSPTALQADTPGGATTAARVEAAPTTNLQAEGGGRQPSSPVAAERGSATLAPEGSTRLTMEPDAPANGTTKLATLATPATPTLSQADRIRGFLRTYRNKDCIFATPRALDAAHPQVDGLGGQSGALEEFSAAFRQSVGVEPELAMKPVMDAQCPAVDFIRTIIGETEPSFRVVLDRDSIQDGDFLAGHLDGEIGRAVKLLLVDDDGAVRDISDKFQRLADGKNFFFIEQIRILAEGRSRSQLILAITTATPLEVNVTHDTGEALAVFQSIANQAASSETPLRAAYAVFRVN